MVLVLCLKVAQRMGADRARDGEIRDWTQRVPFASKCPSSSMRRAS